MIYPIILSPVARKMLAKIADRRVCESIRDRIDGLVQDPDKQGKPLVGEFAGCRSIRAVGQCYRIIYRVEEQAVVVLAVGIRKQGSRRDVYSLARKLLRLGLSAAPRR